MKKYSGAELAPNPNSSGLGFAKVVRSANYSVWLG